MKKQRSSLTEQIVDAITKLEDRTQEVILRLLDVIAELRKLGAHNETARKLSEAGKKSAAARKAKFGSAAPGKKLEQEVVPAPFRVAQSVRSAVVEFDLTGEPLREPVRKKREKKEKPAPDGAMIWMAYTMCYRNRYGTEPLRNAKVNSQCSQIAQQVGPEIGRELVAYYLTRNDMVYVKASHTLGVCLMDLQKLHTERFNGTVITGTDARRTEAHSQTDRALSQYIEKQNVEQVREQVRVKEAKDAAR